MPISFLKFNHTILCECPTCNHSHSLYSYHFGSYIKKCIVGNTQDEHSGENDREVSDKKGQMRVIVIIMRELFQIKRKKNSL